MSRSFNLLYVFKLIYNFFKLIIILIVNKKTAECLLLFLKNNLMSVKFFFLHCGHAHQATCLKINS